MPYTLKKSPKKNLYWVVNAETGRKYSRKPIPKERAERQRRAIYASENGYELSRSRTKKYKKTPRYIQRYKNFAEE
jgi:hypothetical protein